MVVYTMVYGGGVFSVAVRLSCNGGIIYIFL